MIREIITQRMAKFFVYETLSRVFVRAELYRRLHLSETICAHASPENVSARRNNPFLISDNNSDYAPSAFKGSREKSSRRYKLMFTAIFMIYCTWKY